MGDEVVVSNSDSSLPAQPGKESTGINELIKITLRSPSRVARTLSEIMVIAVFVTPTVILVDDHLKSSHKEDAQKEDGDRMRNLLKRLSP